MLCLGETYEMIIIEKTEDTVKNCKSHLMRT